MKSFKSGTYMSQGHYKSFAPTQINKAWILDNMEIIKLLGISVKSWGVKKNGYFA